MAKYSYELVCCMMDAIYEGYTFTEFYTYNYKLLRLPSKKISLKAWNRAKSFIANEEEWRKYLQQQVSTMWSQFVKKLDTYYEEGFGIFNLDETLGVSKEAILEMINRDGA